MRKRLDKSATQLVLFPCSGEIGGAWLAQEGGANAHPPRRGVEIGLHAEDLEHNEQGKGVEIHFVDPAVDDEVAQDAEKHQNVYAGGRVGKRYQGKAGPGCVGEAARGYQHKPAVELGPPAPVDGERKRNSEADQVHQLDDEEGGCLGEVEAL